MTPEIQQEFKRGIKDVLPIMIGIIPFGLILGAQAGQKGMSVLETVMMMGLNFAGGSEFAAVNLWTSPLPVLLIIATTAMINSRHILMGAAMAPLLRHLPLRKVLPALFMMTDESWAMGIADSQKHAQKQPARLTQLQPRHYRAALVADPRPFRAGCRIQFAALPRRCRRADELRPWQRTR